MLKVRSFHRISLILVWHSLACSSSKVERAKSSFEAYVQALQQHPEAAKGFWNKPETKRYQMYDWQWGYLVFQGVDPRHLNYRVISSAEKDGCVILGVEWFYQEGKAGPLQKDTRYFIEEDGRMVGANAIFVQARNWNSKKSRHFDYHFKRKQDQPARTLLEKMDRFYDKVAGFLSVDYGDRIDYYKCDSTSEVGRLFEMEPSLARSQSLNGVVASVQRFVPHEVVHIISYRMLPQGERRIPLGCLDEGLSYYLGGASFFSPDLLLDWGKGKLKQDQSVLLDTLIHNPWAYGSNESAGLTSSLVKFLIETQGMTKFREFFAAGDAQSEERQTLQEIYGKSLDQLQAEWKSFVAVLSLPEIRLTDGIGGQELLNMSDPPGDDKGDGDYAYPKNQKALPGIFDLTGFKVSQDDKMVYFQLRFANLSHAELSSDTAFNGTFAAIAIDSDNRNESGSTQLFFGNGNFEFSTRDAYEFVIEVSNAGILLYDQDWVWHLLFLKASQDQDHIRGNEISFAVPKEIIGIPDSSWKFQVVIGGQKGGYRNTAYGVGRLMKVGELSTIDQGGGGTNTIFNPDIYDILTLPEWNQAQILSNYSVAKKRRAVVPMIILKAKE
jgi:hypothetical protein